jgi:hypothetical protein
MKPVEHPGPAFRLVVTSLIALGILLRPTFASAASSQTPITFPDIVDASALVVLADVTGTPETGFSYSVETYLKGSGPHELRFPPDIQSAVEAGWNRVVIAFSRPSTDDVRAPTTAWHVGPDGTIDPEGYRQYVGQPATVSAMLAYFGLGPSHAEGTLPPASIAMSAAAAGTPDAAEAEVANDPGRFQVAIVALVATVLVVLLGQFARGRAHHIRQR